MGIVVLAPLLGGPQSRSRRSLVLASIMAVETVAVAWLLMEYAIQASATRPGTAYGRHVLVKSALEKRPQAWVFDLVRIGGLPETLLQSRARHSGTVSLTMELLMYADDQNMT